jgi:uncharacterized protein (TIRG00374 family)
MRRLPPRTVKELTAIAGCKSGWNVAHEKVGQSGMTDAAAERVIAGLIERYPYDTAYADSLRRCTKCILPETMPFITFDADGVCSYCRHHRPLEYKGVDALRAEADRVRRSGNAPECVVGVSGGRDSLYALHYVKKVLGLNAVAYTYDWGMVTDLARRNISRICSRLGVEHILVSADIERKRRYISRNVGAWLKKPELGLIPLFMAGDKQYYHYLYQVRKQLGVEMAVLGENMLERTDFKSGFAGVPPFRDDPGHVYTLPLPGQLKLTGYYLFQYLRNPGYFNASLPDTMWAYASYYLSPKRYLNLYGYIPWIEDEIIGTLRSEYDFELSTDSCSTWRIGDGTAAFYNYIYYKVTGFTENDTFRSNQIREGVLSREEALQLVAVENRPRYATIFWYLNIIDLDVDVAEVFKLISEIPRLKKVILKTVSKKDLRWSGGALLNLLPLAGLAILFFILLRIDLAGLVTLLNEVQLYYILAVALLSPLVMVLIALRWRWLLALLGCRYGMLPAFNATVSGSVLGEVTPGRAGELWRACAVHRATGMSGGKAVLSVILDRLYDLAALVPGLIFALAVFRPETALPVGAVAALLVFICVPVCLRFQNQLRLKAGQLLDRLYSAATGRWKLFIGESAEFAEGFFSVSLVQHVLFCAFSALIWLYKLALLFILAAALGISVPIRVLVATGVAGIAVAFLPVSVSGLGTRDGVFILLLQAYGVSAEAALGLSFLYLITGLWSVAFPAAILYIVALIRKAYQKKAGQ